jgi:zinc protease
MRRFTSVAILVAALASPLAAQRAQGPQVPIEYQKLANGLRVVLAPDHTAPLIAVAVYYHVGFRLEPRGRTGFAHLFEHLMFQGSQNLGKMQFVRLVQRNGGILNGSTRFDFTNYFEVMPAHTLETALWAEADRMRGLDISQQNLQNQQDVVKNEVRVNVLNQPYGSFPWIDVPMAAFTNWQNAHNFYGDFQDLDAATLADARDFFHTYYAPGNAALVVTGDFEPREAMAMVHHFFDSIPAGPAIPPLDVTEPRQTAERRQSRTDALAPRPAIAVGYQMPARFTPEWFAMGLLDQILGQGNDSWLYQELAQRRGYTGSVDAGINWGLGSQFDYEGPMLWMVRLTHDQARAPDTVLAAIDQVIERVRSQPVDAATLQRARTKMRSNLYDQEEQLFGFGRANLLASFALFDDDPGRINRLEAGFDAVTPAIIQRTAQEYLRPTNRTVYTIVPGAAGTGQE